MSIYFNNKIINSKLFLGDKMKEDLEKIIQDNRGLIYSIIKRFKKGDIDDLYQAGCLGIIKAYKNYRKEEKTKFTTYAYPFIVGEIYKSFTNNRNIHMSPENIKLLYVIQKTKEKLTNHLGRVPNNYEIANFLEIDEKKVNDLLIISETESLDYNYEDYNLYDYIQKEDVSKDELIDLKNALLSLNKDEKCLIRARYFNNITQKDLANIYNTNQVKISRDEKKILCKLKSLI